MPTLFDPLTAGALSLKNRMVMAPLTRGRAEGEHVPGDLMVEYYKQRAGAGLIVSEATAISAEGFGWANAPGIYSGKMRDGWKRVTDAVHDAGGLIALQLWHMGRLSHPDYQPNHKLPLSASDVPAPGETRDANGARKYVAPRAMTKDDIKRTVEDYATAAKLARAAGFDAVEIHGAHGYLIDQFLRDSSNKRTDEYGGSIENRTRFLKEVTDAVVSAVGSDRTGLRLSPFINGSAQAPETSDLGPLFVAATKAIAPFNLAFLHVREIWKDEKGVAKPLAVTPLMRKEYKGALLVNDSYDYDSGTEILAKGGADAVVYGKLFLANPDLVERFRTGAPLNAWDTSTFYMPGPHGYVDYPTAQDKAA